MNRIEYEYEYESSLVREDFKLLDDGREIPESQEKGWPFDSGL
jgi:hypothetical protein